MAFRIVTALRGEVEAVLRPGGSPSRHHLNARQPRIPHQRLACRRLSDLRSVEQSGQLTQEARERFRLRLLRRGSQQLHVLIADALSEAVDQIAVDAHACRRVREVHIPVVCDVRAVDILPDLAHQGQGEQIDPAFAGAVQQFEVVK
jgi:hypothetical protein